MLSTQSEAPLLDITAIQFGLADPDEWRKLAAEPVTKATANTKGIQQPNTVNSAAAGYIDRNIRCNYCKLSPCVCDGKYLYIELAYVMFNVHFFPKIIYVLNSHCRYCTRLLLDKNTLNELCEERNIGERLKNISKASLQVRRCDVQSIKSRKKKELKPNATDEEKEEFENELLERKNLEREHLIANQCCGGIQYKYVRKFNEIHCSPKETSEDLNEKGEPMFVQNKFYFISPAEVYEILKRITTENQKILGFNNEFCKPKNMMMEVLPVPPMKDRPTSVFNAGVKRKTDNPTTKRCWDIAKVNEALKLERCKIIKRYRAKMNPIDEDMSCDEDEGRDTKVKSTLTAVIRSEKNRKATLANKDQNRPQLDLHNDKLKFASFPRSGDATIPDHEWENFLENDVAFHEATRPLIDDLQYLIGSASREDTKMPKSIKKMRGRGGGGGQYSYRQRLKGKKGFIRSNMQARRNDFSMRGVITPNPDIDVDELGIPIACAMHVTTPEIVTMMNIEQLKRLVLNGPLNYPGANHVSGYFKKFFDNEKVDESLDCEERILSMKDLSSIDRYDFVQYYFEESMKHGALTVHRHIIDGDYVPFNRQPSLHKFSFMAHRAKIIAGNTLEMNPAACHAYRADLNQTFGVRTGSCLSSCIHILDEVNSVNEY